MVKYEVRKLQEYIDWYDEETSKSQAQIEKRLDNIVQRGHFGTSKSLKDGLHELKFNDGRRIYYSVFKDEDGSLVILLYGGNKNGQSKDIAKARSLLKKIIGS